MVVSSLCMKSTFYIFEIIKIFPLERKCPPKIEIEALNIEAGRHQ